MVEMPEMKPMLADYRSECQQNGQHLVDEETDVNTPFTDPRDVTFTTFVPDMSVNAVVSDDRISPYTQPFLDMICSSDDRQPVDDQTPSRNAAVTDADDVVDIISSGGDGNSACPKQPSSQLPTGPCDNTRFNAADMTSYVAMPTISPYSLVEQATPAVAACVHPPSAGVANLRNVRSDNDNNTGGTNSRGSTKILPDAASQNLASNPTDGYVAVPWPSNTTN
jgi:hypothetical protein